MSGGANVLHSTSRRTIRLTMKCEFLRIRKRVSNDRLLNMQINARNIRISLTCGSCDAAEHREEKHCDLLGFLLRAPPSFLSCRVVDK